MTSGLHIRASTRQGIGMVHAQGERATRHAPPAGVRTLSPPPPFPPTSSPPRWCVECESACASGLGIPFALLGSAVLTHHAGTVPALAKKRLWQLSIARPWKAPESGRPATKAGLFPLAALQAGPLPRYPNADKKPCVRVLGVPYSMDTIERADPAVSRPVDPNGRSALIAAIKHHRAEVDKAMRPGMRLWWYEDAIEWTFGWDSDRERHPVVIIEISSEGIQVAPCSRSQPREDPWLALCPRSLSGPSDKRYLEYGGHSTSYVRLNQKTWLPAGDVSGNSLAVAETADDVGAFAASLQVPQQQALAAKSRAGAAVPAPSAAPIRTAPPRGGVRVRAKPIGGTRK